VGKSGEHAVVLLAAGDLEKLAGISDVVVKTRQRGYYPFEGFALLAEFLRALIVVPDGGVFDQFSDLGKPLLFGIEVKDTSAAPQYGSRRPEVVFLWR
jgi:hypothetical protein